MRILHAVNLLEATGNGIANVCIDLACRQAESGHAVAIATRRGGFSELALRHGVDLLPVDFRTGRSPARMLAALRQMRRAVQRFRPELIHAHTLAATVLARLSAVGTGAKVVATVHNEYQPGALVMAFAHRLVGVSAAVSESLRRRGVPAFKIRTVMNGTVGSPRRPDAVEPLDLPAPRLVAIGAVSLRKGADLLLDAFERLSGSHPELELWFVGNVDVPELARRARRIAVARIHFPGFDSQPARYLGPGAIHVLPSRRDPAPLAVIEAMEVGAPIVAAAVDGVPEMLGHGAHGLLVPPEDADALADALGRLLDDPALSADYARRSAAGAERFSLERVGREYDRVYEDLMHRRRRAGHVKATTAPQGEAS